MTHIAIPSRPLAQGIQKFNGALDARGPLTANYPDKFAANICTTNTNIDQYHRLGTEEGRSGYIRP